VDEGEGQHAVAWPLLETNLCSAPVANGDIDEDCYMLQAVCISYAPTGVSGDTQVRVSSSD
jgi:hypothetical protein